MWHTLFSHSERGKISLPVEASAPAFTQPQPFQPHPPPPLPLFPLSFTGSVLDFSPSPGLVFSGSPRHHHHHHYSRAWRDGWRKGAVFSRRIRPFVYVCAGGWGDSSLWLWSRSSSSWCRERRERGRVRERETEAEGGKGDREEKKEMSRRRVWNGVEYIHLAHILGLCHRVGNVGSGLCE